MAGTGLYSGSAEVRPLAVSTVFLIFEEMWPIFFNMHPPCWQAGAVSDLLGAISCPTPSMKAP